MDKLTCQEKVNLAGIALNFEIREDGFKANNAPRDKLQAHHRP